MTNTTSHTHTIDATDKRLGDVATSAARILLGKNDPSFTKHTIADVHVTIDNASKMDIPERRKTDIYQSYSGYPGGRHTETLEHLGERLGYSEALRRSIAGMLPKNKLKKPVLKNLTINE